MHKRKNKPRLAAVCFALVLAMLGSFSAGALSHYIQPTVESRVRADYAEVPIYVNGQALDMDARLIMSTTYVPLRAFCEAMGECDICYDSASRVATVTADGIYLRVGDGSRLLTVNGRCLYSDMAAVILDDNRLYVPIRLLEKAYGVTVSWDGATRSVSVSGAVKPILAGDIYYRADEVYWLAKIISAESRGEPFLGQIAVGNVVLNRVHSRAYPNTIYGVIFDRYYGVQFAPVSNGTIHLPATESAVLAAKVCLEGYSVSHDALFFIEPRLAESLWVPKNRPYLFTIGAHDFYR